MLNDIFADLYDGNYFRSICILAPFGCNSDTGILRNLQAKRCSGVCQVCSIKIYCIQLYTQISLAHVCRHYYIFTYLFQVPESERQCKVCSKPKQFIQVSGINFSKPNVWKGSNELNKHYIFEQLHSFTITVLLKNVDTCRIKSSKCDVLVWNTVFSMPRNQIKHYCI